MYKAIVVLLAASAAVVATAQTTDNISACFYLQPSVLIALPGDDFESTGGFSAALGVSFLRHHSVEAEFIRFETAPDVPSPAYDLEFTSMVVTYKYSFLITKQLSVYVGQSIGQVSQKISARDGYYIIGDDKDDVFALGPSGGIRYAFNERVAFDAGLKIMAVGDTRFTTGGFALMQAGLKFQF